MDAKVKSYIDAGKNIVKQKAENEEQSRIYNKRQKLIDLGLFETGRIVYTDEYNYNDPNCEWDGERSQWKSTEIIVPDVTDEEFEQILESERIQKETSSFKTSISNKSAAIHKDKEVEKETVYKYAVNPSAESMINVIASIVLVLGILIGVVCIIAAIALFNDYETESGWTLLCIGVGAFILFFITWAFIKVLVNISRNMYNIIEAIRVKK